MLRENLASHPTAGASKGTPHGARRRAADRKPPVSEVFRFSARWRHPLSQDQSRRSEHYGCKLECDVELQTNQEVWVKLTGMEAVRAHIIWNDGGQAGCAFSTPINPSILESFIASPRKDSREIFRRREVPPKVASRPGLKWRLFG